MSIETEGSFNRDPHLSEKHLADQLTGLLDLTVPNDTTVIRWELSLKLDTPSDNPALYQAIQQLEARFGYEIEGSVKIKFGINNDQKTLDPKVLSFQRKNSASYQVLKYDNYLYSSATIDPETGEESAQDPIEVEKVSSLITALGVDTHTPINNQGDLKAILWSGYERTINSEVSQYVRIVDYVQSDDEDTPEYRLVVDKDTVKPEEYLAGSVVLYSESKYSSSGDIVNLISLVEIIYVDEFQGATIYTHTCSQNTEEFTVEKATQQSLKSSVVKEQKNIKDHVQIWEISKKLENYKACLLKQAQP